MRGETGSKDMDLIFFRSLEKTKERKSTVCDGVSHAVQEERERQEKKFSKFN